MRVAETGGHNIDINETGVSSAGQVARAIDEVYRTESRRALATLIRLLGDFELAEEALHDAFVAAVEQWQRDGIPANPRAWLVSTGRFKAIDNIRRRTRHNESLKEMARDMEIRSSAFDAEKGASDSFLNEDSIADDQLRLIFTCCHPDLAPDAQVALTLREVCGLSTEEIARAFLSSPSTIAQRIVRAKARIREAKIPYQIPDAGDMPERLDTVLHVIYLVFNEGYSASAGEAHMRVELCSEAIRLARLLAGLLPDPEALGLLALMILHDSRRMTRTSPSGEVVLLEDQDRSLWNRALIEEGTGIVEQIFAARRLGPYSIQAAIAAVHAQAPTAADTDWNEIVGLYGILTRVAPSPVLELNRAVAVAMRDGSESGLAIVDDILARGELQDYHLAHAARAELCRRLGRNDEARSAYLRARSLTLQEPERRYIDKRLSELPR